jgi:hypothetical protein
MEKKIEDIQVGQIVFREFHHRGQPVEIKPYTVTKVGKKYFYLNNDDRYPIGKDDLMHRDKMYTQSNFQVYRTEQEITERQEKAELIQKIKSFCDDCKGEIKHCTLEQIKQISAAIDSTKQL